MNGGVRMATVAGPSAPSTLTHIGAAVIVAGGAASSPSTGPFSASCSSSIARAWASNSPADGCSTTRTPPILAAPYLRFSIAA